MAEIVALPQQRLAQVERQRVRQAATEVQSGRMAAARAEIRVGLTGQAALTLGHRLDAELGLLEKFVQTPADDRIALGVQDSPALQIACGGEPSDTGLGDGPA